MDKITNYSGEFVSVKEANELVDKSTSSLTRFCKKHEDTDNIKVEENDRGRPVFLIKKTFLFDNFKKLKVETDQTVGQGSKLDEKPYENKPYSYENKIGSEKATSTALATQTQECKDLKKQVHKLEKQKKNILIILPVISVIIIIIIIVGALLYKKEAVSIISNSHTNVLTALSSSHKKELSHLKNSSDKDILHIKENSESKIDAITNSLKEKETHYNILLGQQKKVNASTEKTTQLYEKRNKELETLLLTQKKEIKDLKDKLTGLNNNHNSNYLQNNSEQGSNTASVQPSNSNDS